MRKAFLEGVVVELVNNFDKKSIASVGKGKSIAKVSFKHFGGSYTYIL